MTDARDDPADVVRRWEASGGHWRVLHRSDTSFVLGLFSCDGREEMQRLTATTADLDAFLPAGPAVTTNCVLRSSASREWQPESGHRAVVLACESDLVQPGETDQL